jgi:hypothetical protein
MTVTSSPPGPLLRIVPAFPHAADARRLNRGVRPVIENHLSSIGRPSWLTSRSCMSLACSSCSYGLSTGPWASPGPRLAARHARSLAEIPHRRPRYRCPHRVASDPNAPRPLPCHHRAQRAVSAAGIWRLWAGDDARAAERERGVLPILTLDPRGGGGARARLAARVPLSDLLAVG